MKRALLLALLWVFFLVSLALLVATGGLAVGAWGPWEVRWGDSRTGVGYRVEIDSYGPGIQWEWGIRTLWLTGKAVPGNAVEGQGRDLPGGWDRAGFHRHAWEWVSRDITGAVLPGIYGEQREFSIDIDWFLAVFALLTVVFGIPVARRLFPKRPAHLCKGCGYDLRASPGRCPECGRARGVVRAPSCVHDENTKK